LLTRLQRDVLQRKEERSSRDQPIDDSIVFLACPGIRREIEVIASEIWSLLAGSVGPAPPLRFHQIALVLAGRNREAYRAHIGAVFTETFEIPHHFIDVPIRTSSRVVEAVELLLALPYSRWTRQDLLRILLHPLVFEPAADRDEWVRWLDDLCVLHGADHGDHVDTYIEKDLYNWDQGMRRLALGAFMPGEESGDQRTYSSNGNEYLPLECATDRLESASKLIVLVRSLIADARFIRRERLVLTDWADLLKELVAAYVRCDAEQDERDMMRVLGLVQRLKQIDTGTRVSFRIASEILRASLSSLGINRGQPLADGVAVASLAELAAIPFRVAFVVGLGEGLFPSSERRGQLDLRSSGRRANDISARDIEEYQFLERILTTDERLYLSWVSRDARTGDPLEPSSSVLELREILERDYGADLDRITRRPPLRRYDRRRFEQHEDRASPAASREMESIRLRESMIASCGPAGVEAAGAAIDLELLREALPREKREGLEKHLGLLPVPELIEKKSEGMETIPVPYAALRNFLEDPREGWKRFVLNLREVDDDQDPLAREDETLSTSALDATILLREVLGEKLVLEAKGDEETSFEEIYDERARILELKGTLPTGVFARSERHKHLGILASWRTQLSRIFGERPEILDRLRFGRAREHAPAEGLLDPVVIELEISSNRRIRVELSGRTELLISPSSSIVLMAKEEGEPRECERLALRGFLDHVALSALHKNEDADHRALVLFSGGEIHQVRFLPFTSTEAKDYLAILLFDLFSSAHTYDLPLDLALRGAQGPLAPIIERRFGPYFARRREEMR
jgi:exodeoxyribonuclease V gamma subunit